MINKDAHFSIGQLIDHKRFDYRGVIFDVDPQFMLSEEWYQAVARSRPPKDEPWYHVLVDNADHSTYVAERHLQAAATQEPVNHPLLDNYFKGFIDYRHIPYRSAN
jgi:heat shock protein HspQ